MFKDFNFEIISPDKMIFSLKTNEVIIPSYEGHMTILKRSHSNYYIFKTRNIDY